MGPFSEACWRRRLAPTGHWGKTIVIPKLVGPFSEACWRRRLATYSTCMTVISKLLSLYPKACGCCDGWAAAPLLARGVVCKQTLAGHSDVTELLHRNHLALLLVLPRPNWLYLLTQFHPDGLGAWPSRVMPTKSSPTTRKMSELGMKPWQGCHKRTLSSRLESKSRF